MHKQPWVDPELDYGLVCTIRFLSLIAKVPKFLNAFFSNQLMNFFLVSSTGKLPTSNRPNPTRPDQTTKNSHLRRCLVVVAGMGCRAPGTMLRFGTWITFSHDTADHMQEDIFAQAMDNHEGFGWRTRTPPPPSPSPGDV